ncbi:DUF6448 family protein [Streptomyces sp. NPDC006624]|uniref:DUF6448 family protein n=1 Tax=Streptomyces sp. NPDC006624 TaxID=3154892 RepID=UPI0033B53FC6
MPFVPGGEEADVREAFQWTFKVRRLGSYARELADRWFFETVVRVHRAGEGSPFTGLKPAGLDVGPVISAVERARDSGFAEELIGLLCGVFRDQVEGGVGSSSVAADPRPAPPVTTSPRRPGRDQWPGLVERRTPGAARGERRHDGGREYVGREVTA